MSTVYRLFDPDYIAYVISDVVELPLERSQALLDMILPKMKLRAVSIDHA
jgi:hypothetical protein